jgi:hypothetical protein
MLFWKSNSDHDRVQTFLDFILRLVVSLLKIRFSFSGVNEKVIPDRSFE